MGLVRNSLAGYIMTKWKIKQSNTTLLQISVRSYPTSFANGVTLLENSEKAAKTSLKQRHLIALPVAVSSNRDR